jgi:sodium/hydrogen antiporter
LLRRRYGMIDDMDVLFLILGVSLLAGSLLTGLANRTFLSLTALFVAIGLVVGNLGFGLLEISPEAPNVHLLVTVTLVVVLFRDAIEIEQEMLLSNWKLPLRKLLLAMPLTAGLVAASAHLLLGLGWLEALLIGALIAPTDPILSSSVVTNRRVPAKIRHSLNLESGLNDGLALPAILILIAALASENFTWWSFLILDIGGGVLVGAAMGWLLSVALRSMRSARPSRPTAPRTCSTATVLSRSLWPRWCSAPGGRTWRMPLSTDRPSSSRWSSSRSSSALAL